MSSLRIIRWTLLSGRITRHVATLSGFQSNEKLLSEGRAESNVYQCKRLAYSQASRKYENLLRDHEETSKSRENLLNKIKKSHVEYKIVSLANVITTSRVLTAPAMGYFIMNNMHSHALVCCAYAAFSDVADKLVARLTNQSSPLNFTLDVLADKMVLATSCIALHRVDILAIFFIKCVIVRDFLLLAGAATIRYHGFDKRPTLRQYLDLNNYPSRCFTTTPLNRLITGLQYSFVMTLLGLNHLEGDYYYDWAIYLSQGFIMALSSMSIAWACATTSKSGFSCWPRNWF